MSAAARTITLDERRLSYLDWGNPGAPALLLLHGGSAHAHWWDWFAPAVADRFRVVALDLRGHGDSEWARPPAYEIDDYATDVTAFVAALGLSPLRLIGHSLGGIVAATAAARLAADLAALVIVDSRTKARDDGGLRFMRRLARMPIPRYRSLEQGVSQYRLLPADSTAPPEILAAIATHALRPLADGTYTFKFDRAALAAIKAHDISAELAQLRCPILAVRGVLSPLMPDVAIEALRAAAPQLQAVAIAGAHHHVMLDRPGEFAAAVAAFLAPT